MISDSIEVLMQNALSHRALRRQYGSVHSLSTWEGGEFFDAVAKLGFRSFAWLVATYTAMIGNVCIQLTLGRHAFFKSDLRLIQKRLVFGRHEVTARSEIFHREGIGIRLLPENGR